MKLNLGCGSQILAGWTNVDYALGARFAKVPLFRSINRSLGLFDSEWDSRIHLHDLTRPLPWPDDSASVVYSSHTLEHLSREQGRHLLEQAYRVLKRGGIIRIVVPDLKSYVTKYLEGELKADDFVEAIGVLYGNPSSTLKRRLAPFIQFPHKCMYDTPRLVAILEEIGFDATARGPFESDIPEIRALEIEARTVDAVIVEGRKR